MQGGRCSFEKQNHFALLLGMRRELHKGRDRWISQCQMIMSNYTKTDDHDGVITHLEPDILECEVKWALGSITVNKASGGDGISVELFQILKDDAVKVLHSICQQIWKTQQWLQDWKRSVFIPIPKKGNTKECSNYHTVALISHDSKFSSSVVSNSLRPHESQHVRPPCPSPTPGVYPNPCSSSQWRRPAISSHHTILK